MTVDLGIERSALAAITESGIPGGGADVVADRARAALAVGDTEKALGEMSAYSPTEDAKSLREGAKRAAIAVENRSVKKKIKEQVTRVADLVENGFMGMDVANRDALKSQLVDFLQRDHTMTLLFPDGCAEMVAHGGDRRAFSEALAEKMMRNPAYVRRLSADLSKLLSERVDHSPKSSKKTELDEKQAREIALSDEETTLKTEKTTLDGEVATLGTDLDTDRRDLISIDLDIETQRRNVSSVKSLVESSSGVVAPAKSIDLTDALDVTKSRTVDAKDVVAELAKETEDRQVKEVEKSKIQAEISELEGRLTRLPPLPKRHKELSGELDKVVVDFGNTNSELALWQVHQSRLAEYQAQVTAGTAPAEIYLFQPGSLTLDKIDQTSLTGELQSANKAVAIRVATRANLEAMKSALELQISTLPPAAGVEVRVRKKLSAKRDELMDCEQLLARFDTNIARLQGYQQELSDSPHEKGVWVVDPANPTVQIRITGADAMSQLTLMSQRLSDMEVAKATRLKEKQKKEAELESKKSRLAEIEARLTAIPNEKAQIDAQIKALQAELKRSGAMSVEMRAKEDVLGDKFDKIMRDTTLDAMTSARGAVSVENAAKTKADTEDAGAESKVQEALKKSVHDKLVKFVVDNYRQGNRFQRRRKLRGAMRDILSNQGREGFEAENFDNSQNVLVLFRINTTDTHGLNADELTKFNQLFGAARGPISPSRKEMQDLVMKTIVELTVQRDAKWLKKKLSKDKAMEMVMMGSVLPILVNRSIGEDSLRKAANKYKHLSGCGRLASMFESAGAVHYKDLTFNDMLWILMLSGGGAALLA